MNNYIVMQGHTYKEERDLGIIWSPKKDKRDRVPHSWKRMTEVKKGDRIFHYVKGDIVAISIAKKDCETGKKPTVLQSFDNWAEDGYLVTLQSYELKFPIRVLDNFSEINHLLPVKYSPLQSDGRGNQGYLYPCNDELALKLLELISVDNLLDKHSGDESDDNNVKIESNANELASIVFETESEVRVKTRIGQNRFRNELFPIWDGKCALCEIDLPELLIASHSKPWKDSSNEERLNPFNGLLLCRNHDALYDQGLISIDRKGNLHISKKVEKENEYGLNSSMQVKIQTEHEEYFEWHKNYIFSSN